MGIIGWVLFGLVVGVIGKLLMPGRDPGGWVVTILLGIAGALLGGFLGRATGVGSGGVDNTEAKVEFQLFAVGETAARLKSAASAKEEGEEASAGTALDQEAKQVSAEVRKKR